MQYNNNPYAQNQQLVYNRNNFNNINMLKGKPVASVEEARATSIDFDGSIFFFPDLANKRIYTKQINMDGTATMQCYELSQLPIEQTNNINTNNFITREEFNNALQELTAKVQSLAPQKEDRKYEF